MNNRHTASHSALWRRIMNRCAGGLLFSLSGMACLALYSCQQLSPPLVIPAYGHVDSISYRFDTLLQSENSRWAGITDAWVYLDDNPVGAFQMPCTFPMIASNGMHTISIYPGIMMNGTADTRAKYPFYTYYTVNVNLTQGKTTRFSPTCTYTAFAHFAWLEYFSNGCSITSKNLASDTVMNRVVTGGFPCKYYGAAILDSNNPTRYQSLYQGVSDTMTLPKNNTLPVYLELNYNCNGGCLVGLYASVSGNALGYQLPASAFLIPTGGLWQKIYINLEPMISSNPNGEPFSVYFAMYRTPGSTQGYLYLDNIKLVY